MDSLDNSLVSTAAGKNNSDYLHIYLKTNKLTRKNWYGRSIFAALLGESRDKFLQKQMVQTFWSHFKFNPHGQNLRAQKRLKNSWERILTFNLCFGNILNKISRKIQWSSKYFGLIRQNKI